MLVSRKRLLLLLVAGLGLSIVAVLRLRTPTATAPQQAPPPPPPATRREPALQADAEGYYVPGYAFSVNRFRFVSFTLHPEALVTFAQTTGGTRESAGCIEAVIRPDLIHLRCDYPQLGTVTIDGKFLTRLATTRLDAPVVAAVVTVRAPSGDTLYSARDRFAWQEPE